LGIGGWFFYSNAQSGAKEVKDSGVDGKGRRVFTILEVGA